MLVEYLVGGTGPVILVAAFAQYFFGISLTLVAIFLILLVLVQRGRGGGLAGAFGGMGGQSAFGTKAGDTFTKVTIGASVVWLLLCVASVKLLGTSSGSFGQATAPSQTQIVPGLDGADDTLLPGLEGEGVAVETGTGDEGVAAEITAPPADDAGGSIGAEAGSDAGAEAGSDATGLDSSEQ